MTCRRVLGKYPSVGKSREKEDLEEGPSQTREQLNYLEEPWKSPRKGQQKSGKGVPRGSCRRGYQQKSGETKKPKLTKKEGPEEEPVEGLREITRLQGRVWKQRRRGSTRNRKGRPR